MDGDIERLRSWRTSQCWQARAVPTRGIHRDGEASPSFTLLQVCKRPTRRDQFRSRWLGSAERKSVHRGGSITLRTLRAPSFSVISSAIPLPWYTSQFSPYVAFDPYSVERHPTYVIRACCTPPHYCPGPGFASLSMIWINLSACRFC